MTINRKNGHIMGFDFGLKRIGVAVADFEIAHAEPLITLESSNKTPNWNAISKLVETWQPIQFVVGKTNAISINGQVIAFARSLKKRYDCPVAFSEEAYTSTTANEMLSELRQSGRTKKIKKEEIDKLAATLILRTWLSEQGMDI